MGEHKYNPTAIAAKNGELPTKKKPISKRERDRLIYAELHRRLGLPFFPLFSERGCNAPQPTEGE